MGKKSGKKNVKRPTTSSQSDTGKKGSEKQKEIARKNQYIAANAVKRPVLQFTKDGDFVAEYESCNDAIRAIGKPNAKISEVCSGKRKSTYGFVFKYKEV